MTAAEQMLMKLQNVIQDQIKHFANQKPKL